VTSTSLQSPTPTVITVTFKLCRLQGPQRLLLCLYRHPEAGPKHSHPISADLQLSKPCVSNESFRVTGHSLGAALATHTVAYLLANKIKVTDFYNFGSPRVGDSKFTIWFNQAYGPDHFKARVTHRKDPVPHLPLEDWGFLHVNTEIFYQGSKKDGAYVCSDANAEDKKCSDSYKLDTDVGDHVSYYDIDFPGIVLTCQ